MRGKETLIFPFIISPVPFTRSPFPIPRSLVG